MNIGIPLERRDSEHRVGLMPAGIYGLTTRGHAVYVQSQAGKATGFTDQSYADAGAEIVYSAEEVYRRSSLVVKVGPLLPVEYTLIDPGKTILAFQHLSVATREIVENVQRKSLTLIAYELIQDADGSLPVLIPMSEIAGRLCVQVAAHYLQGSSGGRGMLLNGLPGVPPAEVGILGAGVVGFNAARAFAALGAQVTVLDRDLRRLQRIEEVSGGRVITAFASTVAIEHLVSRVDVLIGAVLVPGARAPMLVTREMVRRMRYRAVIVDVSIDQGGCVETSRPTTLSNPVYLEENVLHYCVPNLPGDVAHTATHALTNVALPFLIEIAEQGLTGALRHDPALARGVVTYRGRVTNPEVAGAQGLPHDELAGLL